MIRIVDVGLLPQIQDVDGQKQKGFKIFLGGGLGNRSFVGHQLEGFHTSRRSFVYLNGSSTNI